MRDNKNSSAKSFIKEHFFHDKSPLNRRLQPRKSREYFSRIMERFGHTVSVRAGFVCGFSRDGKGSAIEVTPFDTILVPGEGFPPAENFDASTPTEEFEAKFVRGDRAPKYVATHLNISTNLSESEVKAIAEHENWRVLTCNRGEGMFQLIEIWIEDRFMLEVMTPEQTARYVEITDPQYISKVFANQLPQRAATSELNLIG